MRVRQIFRQIVDNAAANAHDGFNALVHARFQKRDRLFVRLDVLCLREARFAHLKAVFGQDFYGGFAAGGARVQIADHEQPLISGQIFRQLRKCVLADIDRPRVAAVYLTARTAEFRPKHR